MGSQVAHQLAAPVATSLPECLEPVLVHHLGLRLALHLGHHLGRHLVRHPGRHLRRPPVRLEGPRSQRRKLQLLLHRRSRPMRSRRRSRGPSVLFWYS